MRDFARLLPPHTEKVIGEQDLYLEVFEQKNPSKVLEERPPLLFVHGAFTGSWMWSKYIPHFIEDGWKCYVMNLRCHYKSRVMDMSKITFEDYIQDIKEIHKLILQECKKAPIVIGFSMGGILCQKIAETEKIEGLILIDSSISKEVNEICPYEDPSDDELGIVIPAPDRPEAFSIDESEEDILFQRKYLSMESSKVFSTMGCWIKGVEGISVKGDFTCPSLVIKAINNDKDDIRGREEAKHLKAEYAGYRDTTHTGLLIGQKYEMIVERILEFLNHNRKDMA